MSLSLTVLLTLAAGSSGVGALSAETPEEAFERVARTYREAPAFAERFDFVVRFPDGREDPKSMEYGYDGERYFMTLNAADGSVLFHVVAGDGLLRVTQFNVGAAFIEGPFEGSLTEALAGVGAPQVGLTLPPGLAALEPGAQVFVESFGFNVLPGLEVRSASSEQGADLFELVGESGQVSVRAGEGGGHLDSMSLTLGEAGSSLSVEANFESIDVPAGDTRWRIAADGRQAVADFAALEASAYPLGQPAADLSIRDLDGNVVALTDLRGRVVVLDFWATWCVPCWRALEHLEVVAAWAESSGQPVSVYAVDTQEQTGDFASQRDLVASFLKDRDLDLPVLLDVDDSFFSGMHSPGLPSTVLIAPDGTLARFHAGVGDAMVETLQAEVRELLEP